MGGNERGAVDKESQSNMTNVDARVHRNVRVRSGLLGLFSGVPLIGEGILTLSLLGSVAAVGSRGGALFIRRVRLPLALCVFGALSFLVSARIAGVEVSQRSLFTILALGIYLVGFAAITRGSARPMITLVLWTSVGWIAYDVFVGTAITGLGGFYLWKFGIATPVTVAVTCLLILWKVKSSTIGFVLASIGLFSLTQNFRAHALVCLLAAALILVKGRKRIFPRSKLATVLLIVSTLAPLTVLPAVIAQGAFGSALQQKMQTQSDSGGPAFLVGRSEPPLSLAIISANPILGWGRTSSIPSEVILQGLENTRSLGMTGQAQILDGWLRGDSGPALHSIVFHAWAEGGIGAAAFYLLLIFASVRAVIRSKGELKPLVTLVAIQAIWDTLFSPMSNEMVPLWAAIMLLITMVNSQTADLGTTKVAPLPNAVRVVKAHGS